MTARELTVVVVAYGREDLLVSAVTQLCHHHRVLVVDNAQRDECAQVARSLDVTYLRAPSNLGFAGGVNHALDSGRVAGDVLLLNPDASIAPEGVATLQAALHGSARQIACVSPRLRHPSTHVTQRVSWPFPRPVDQWLIALGLGRLVTREDFLVGASLLINADALHQVGPFDERFFLYCEETDWQRRAADHGWGVEVVDAVCADHVGGATSSESERQQAYFHAAHELYIRKWFGTRGWFSYRMACLVGDGLRAIAGGERARAARRRLRIYRTGPVRHRDALLSDRDPR